MNRPKVSAFPKCYIEKIESGELDLFEWIRMSEDLGAEGLELLYPAFFRSSDASYLSEVREAIEATGQVFSLLCFSPDFTHPSADFRAKQVGLQRRAIDVCRALGGRFCRTLSGQFRPEVSKRDGIEYSVNCIEQAADYAQSRGVVLAMENHFKDGFWQHREFAQRAEIFVEIVERIESPAFGVQYDPSNAVVAGDNPIDLLERVRSRVVSMHASDRYLAPGVSLEDLKQGDGTLGYPEGLHHGVVGEGLNDYDAILEILAAEDFSGWISIEDGMNGLDEMARSIDFLKRKIAQYWP